MTTNDDNENDLHKNEKRIINSNNKTEDKNERMYGAKKIAGTIVLTELGLWICWCGRLGCCEMCCEIWCYVLWSAVVSCVVVCCGVINVVRWDVRCGVRSDVECGVGYFWGTMVCCGVMWCGV